MLAYYENYFGVHIRRYPIGDTYRFFRAAAYQDPDGCRFLVQSCLPSFGFVDIENKLAEECGLGSNYLSVVGIRAADNLMRLRMVRQMGPIGLKRRHYYYAVWDWKTADVKRAIDEAGLKLSKSYLYFGSTGDGIDWQFVNFLRNHLPDDYKKLVSYFPLVEMELFRFESVK
jgi:hypothetical protein